MSITTRLIFVVIAIFAAAGCVLSAAYLSPGWAFNAGLATAFGASWLTVWRARQDLSD